jgi:hypothetical protein
MAKIAHSAEFWLTRTPSRGNVGCAMKVGVPAIAFVRGFKVDHEPIIGFKDDWRPVWLITAEFERALARPWKPRRAVDLALDTSERVRK